MAEEGAEEDQAPTPVGGSTLILTWHVAHRMMAEALCLLFMLMGYLRPGDATELLV